MSASGSGSKLNETRSAKSDGIKIEYTGDKTRDKCAELIYDALVFDSGARTSHLYPTHEAGPTEGTCAPASDLILQRAKEIEKTVLNDNGGTSAAYKAKIRSLYVNLKDKNNPTLRESVVSGDLAVAKFCRMSSQVSHPLSSLFYWE